MSNAQPPDNLVGKSIGQFTVLEEIGRGGMATVYRATQQSINRDVALKVLPRAFLHDPGFYERFTREVDVIAHLEHPHIVPIYDYGEFEGMPYIAMRYLAGGSLRTLVERGSPKLQDLVRPIGQIGSALDHAHQQGIIHRDLKPANILLDESGNAYLSDFGIARVLNSELTGSAVIGTPAYMSPEQAMGEALDARADVYGLGVVLFEIITGREPFDAETPMAMILKHMNERVPYLSEFRPDIPPNVDRVIAIATEKQPQNRYSSAGKLADAFAVAVQGKAASIEIPTSDDTSPSAATPALKPAHDLQSVTVTPGTGSPIPAAAHVEDDSEKTRLTDDAITGTPQRRPLMPLWMVGALVVVAVLLAGGVVVANLRPTAAPVPTPIAGAQTVDTASYLLNVPQSWAPADAAYYDIQEPGDTRALVHGWQDANLTALVTVALDANTTVERYTERYYAPREGFSEIDSQTFPDGSFRRSYRTRGFLGFPPGQIDAFFLPHDEQLVVIETYSADSAGNQYVPTFQHVLDSFRLKG